jgi:hypothetical protein
VTSEHHPSTGITNHDHCIMCGELNQLSLRLKFVADGGGGVSAPFLGNSLLQGYDLMASAEAKFMQRFSNNALY